MGDSGTENIRETLKKAREALFKADAPSAHYQGSISVIKDDPPNGAKLRSVSVHSVSNLLRPGSFPIQKWRV